MDKYRVDGEFRIRVKMLPALAFLPVADVVSNNPMQRVARGCTFKPNKMQEGRNTRIQALIAGYNRADAARFLRGIALNYID